jgi:D-xylose transport system permease protein
MSTATPTPAPEQDVTASAVTEEDQRPSLRMAARKLAQGELGSVRVLIVLAVIWLVFALANSSFLTSVNLTNLALQSAGIGMISVGVVLVLLLGEIDLSVGAVSGVCGAIVAVLNVKNGWNPYLAMLAGLLAGALIGFLKARSSRASRSRRSW